MKLSELQSNTEFVEWVTMKVKEYCLLLGTMKSFCSKRFQLYGDLSRSDHFGKRPSCCNTCSDFPKRQWRFEFLAVASRITRVHPKFWDCCSMTAKEYGHWRTKRVYMPVYNERDYVAVAFFNRKIQVLCWSKIQQHCILVVKYVFAMTTYGIKTLSLTMLLYFLFPLSYHFPGLDICRIASTLYAQWCLCDK